MRRLIRAEEVSAVPCGSQKLGAQWTEREARVMREETLGRGVKEVQRGCRAEGPQGSKPTSHSWPLGSLTS